MDGTCWAEGTVVGRASESRPRKHIPTALGSLVSPANPLGTKTIVDEEVCERFVARLDIQTPSGRVFINLAVAKPVSNRAAGVKVADTGEARVAFMCEIHEPCRFSVSKHANGGAALHVEPELEIAVLVKAIQSGSKLFDRLNLDLRTLEAHNWRHARLNVPGFSGGCQRTPRSAVSV